MFIKRILGRFSAALLIASSLVNPGVAASVQPNLVMPTTALTRAQVQHFLRRLGFSAPPATVSSVLASGLPAWLTAQDNWQNLDDSNSELETLPTALVNGNYPDYNIFERAVYQHMMLTPRQLQAKLELHWLDHFSVSLSSVGDPAVMYHYDQTVRANALGNFTTLLTAVSMEPAMLIWLSNNYNSGSDPNENFGREVMQLYTMGIPKLNSSGEPISIAGKPVYNYTEKDVIAAARAMTGYGLVFDSNNNNPQTRFSVQYFPQNHYTGKISYLGKTRNVPTDGTAIAYICNILANDPSTAPFQVKELLQRFVTETPSDAYVAAVTAVWLKAANDPDQIAQVMNAIVNYPDFMTSYQSMPKQPAEQLFYPPTVFSFYRPGNVETTVNTGSILDRTGVFANFTNAQQSGAYTDTYIDIPTLRTLIGSTKGSDISAYLLDALVDGGSPGLQTIMRNYLGATPSDNQILGGIWLLLNAPDYGVN